MVGLGYGLGSSKITAGPALNRLESGWEEGVSPQIRFGRMLGRRLMIGYDQRQWMDEQGFGVNAVRASLQNFAASLTLFPGNPENETGGIYLRGGVGFANARVAVTEDAVGGLDSTHTEQHLDEGGLGLMLGGGYEFRIMRSVAAGLEVSAYHQSIDGDVFDQTWFLPVSLNLAWYF